MNKYIKLESNKSVLPIKINKLFSIKIRLSGIENSYKNVKKWIVNFLKK